MQIYLPEWDSGNRRWGTATVDLGFGNVSPGARTEQAACESGSIYVAHGRSGDHGLAQEILPTYSAVRYLDLYPGVQVTYVARMDDVFIEVEASPSTDTSLVDLRVIGSTQEVMRIDLSNQIWSEDRQFSGTRLSVSVKALLTHLEQGPTEYLYLHTPTVWGVGRSAGEVLDRFPLLVGGSSADRAFAAAVDSHGHVVIAGQTTSSDFPTMNAAQLEAGGFLDAFVTKIDGVTGELIYSTYLGGSGDFDQGIDLAVDAEDNVYVVGTTMSRNFPTTNNAPQSEIGGELDAFLAKFDVQGRLLFSTFLGGAKSDSAHGVAAIDESRVVVVGSTLSLDFPQTHSESRLLGRSDGFATRVDVAQGKWESSRLIGGSGDESVDSVTVDQEQNLYLVGSTNSVDFPVVDAFQPSFQGGRLDGFVAKLVSGAQDVAWASYLGGSREDQLSRTKLALSPDGTVYVVGATASSDFPTTPGALQAVRLGAFDGYLASFSPGGELLHSTYLGGTGNDFPSAIASDGCGKVYVVGTTSSEDFPVRAAVQPRIGGSDDAFITVLSENLQQILSSSFFGGRDVEAAWDVAISGAKSVFVAGGTFSDDLVIGDSGGTLLKGVLDAFVFRQATTTDVGDCNADQQVTVEEIIRMVNIALGVSPVDVCIHADANSDDRVSVDEIVAAISFALRGC